MLEKLRATLDLIYPRNCQFCAAPLGEPVPGVICPSCLALAKRIEPPFCQRCSLPFAGQVADQIECGYCHGLPFHFTHAVAACRAEGLVRDCIHRLKYKRELYYVRHLADWLADAGRARVDWPTVDAIVPVPLHPVKQRDREFNQAELLARQLSREFGKPLITHGVRRVKATPTQTRLDAHARRAKQHEAAGITLRLGRRFTHGGGATNPSLAITFRFRFHDKIFRKSLRRPQQSGTPLQFRSFPLRGKTFPERAGPLCR